MRSATRWDANLEYTENAGGFLEAQEPLPFEEVFLSLVLNARYDLRREVGGALYDLLTPAAHAGWERYLLMRLTRAGAKAAHWQFQVFKTVKQAFPKKNPPPHRGTDCHYRDFVGVRPGHQLQKLLDEFPALARLISAIVKNWLSTVAEFLGRLDADHRELGVHFKTGPFICPVTTLEAGLSDPHQGGRCVVRMCFQNGAKLVYKPRSLAPETHFSALLDHINTTSIPHRLRSAHCWNRDKYGWMEDIEPGPCGTPCDVHAFYWRAGVLLGIIYLARGVDFHQENLIALGGFPVLIDLEGLWHPRKLGKDNTGTASGSVLHTGFLPQGNSRSGTAYEWAALGPQMRSQRSAPTWTHINQDDMALENERREPRQQSHLPVLGCMVHFASEYLSDVQSGYQWVADELLESGAGRGAFERWLRVLSKCPRRLILRRTEHYQAILERFTSPQYLRDHLALTNLLRESTHDTKTELGAELRALEQFDVPYFTQGGRSESSLNELAPWIPTQAEYLSQIPVIVESLSGSPTVRPKSEPDRSTTSSRSCK